MEGRVYICSWERVGERYRVWWTGRPKISAEGDTFDDAEEALADEICGATGDGEAQMEFDPPPPGQEAAAQYVYVSGETYAIMANEEDLFVGGLCPECRQALGARTDATLALASMQSGARNGGWAMIKRHGFRGPSLNFVSEAFRDMLSAAERDSVTWRPMTGPPRGRKKYFEILDARFIVPKVMPAGVPRGGWWCEACGYATDPHYSGARSPRAPTTFVSQRDLGAVQGQSMFVLGRPLALDLCFTRDRWNELLHGSGARGCRSYPLGVLPEHDADRSRPTRTWREANAGAAAIAVVHQSGKAP